MMSKEAIAHYEAALKEAFPRGATGEVFHHWNEARYLIATEALDKMAENARELGLDYESTQRKPLTNEEILAANYPDGEENGPTIAAPDFELICFARQIEAAHGIKENT